MSVKLRETNIKTFYNLFSAHNFAIPFSSIILSSMILSEKVEGRGPATKSGGHRRAATGCAPVVLFEQGADFFSKKVSGAEQNDREHAPRNKCRPGDFTNRDRELDKSLTLLACDFRDDADSVVAGGQTGNPALPASIGKFGDVRFFGVNRNPKDFWNGSRNRCGKRDNFFKGIFVKEIFTPYFGSDYEKLDWFGARVLPSQNGGKRIPMWLELVGDALGQ